MNPFDENKFNEQTQQPAGQGEQPAAPEKKTFFQTVREILTVALKKTAVKVGIAVVIAAIIIGVILSSGDPVQDDLIDYINKDLQTVITPEGEAIDLYDAAKKDTATDHEMYLMLRDEVLPAARKWDNAAEAISVETEEVRKVHELYIEMVNEYYSGWTLMLSALEKQDYTLMTQANEKLNSGKKLGRDFQAELSKLMAEHDVVYE